MVSKIIFIGLLAITSVFGGDELTSVPETTRCSGPLDVVFVLDSSSSIGSENFQLMRDFTSGVIRQLDVGQDTIRVGGSRYTTWTEQRFYLRENNDRESAAAAVTDFPYFGKGTETARALVDTANQQLTVANGWRENTDVPTVVVVITDGITRDFRQLRQSARILKRKTTRVIAVGVGADIRQELEIIATAPAQENVISLDSFADLMAEEDNLLDKICEVEGDQNECTVGNGNCQFDCINTYYGFSCACPEGYNLVGTFLCEDINECANATDNQCGQLCVNTPGSFNCDCNPGFILAINGRSCLVDSCFGNTECSQICNNVIGGDFFCSCEPGYMLEADNRTCTDINECGEDGIGPCEYNCTNTIGSFVCGCPPGQVVLADGLRCGLACYTCDKAFSNEECDELQFCQPNERACQTTVRRENGVTLISKQCKQLEACVNNFIQNPRTAWSPFQCNNITATLSVCRCCCHTAGCNEPADCTLADRIDILCPDPSTVYDPIPPLNLTCGPGPYYIGSTCAVSCPAGFRPDNNVMQVSCQQVPRTTTGAWVGELGTCVDINECLTDNGGCSHTCLNTNGSFVCQCPDATPCNEQVADIFFILDSSSSVGQDNFNTMIRFVNRLGRRYDIGQGPDQTRIGVLTFNRRPRKRFELDSCTSPDDFTEKLNAIVYEGRGTETARAIEFTIRNCLTRAQGRRPNVPLVVVLITDGRSQDHREIPRAARRLHDAADQVFVIGVTRRVNENEIRTLADHDSANYRIIEGFGNLDEDLENIVRQKICTQPEEQQFLTSNNLDCDFDECSINNGGCSNNCTNTVGSYFCSCPEGQALVEDGLSCVVDDCATDNGDCQEACVHFSTGRRCFCGPQRVLINEFDCSDVNECLDENAGCDQECEDLNPGYRCLCTDGFILAPDLSTCEIDSCFENTQCDQICTNVFGGTFVCSCETGYVLNDDGFNCTEINECAVNNGGCQKGCVNTPGSFFCQCDEGESLRQDGRTCGILCYTCNDVRTDDECQESTECAPGQNACFGTIRTRNNSTRITKGCQQREACINNMLQNNRPSGEGPVQCNTDGIHSKCECCCFDSLCGTGLCPFDFVLPTCPLLETDRDDVAYYGLNADGTRVEAGGSLYVDCGRGYELANPDDPDIRNQINCLYDFENETAFWDGDPADLDTCVDIDECLNSTAGCVPPARCENLPGSFECVCPDDFDDYFLVGGIICERDECATEDRGGCSHNCTNTVGSYFCFCPARFALIEGTNICTLDQCGNNLCFERCVNTMDGTECRCNEGRVLADDGFLCVDDNECERENGGCADICINREPGFECACFDGFVLAEDGFSCVFDPCFENNGGCEHNCTRNGELAICSCLPGYSLTLDGGCLDINECLLVGDECENNCTNTEGSFFCECPVGTTLRPDRRTCGRACYVCNGLSTNEACNERGIQVCPDDADACENEVRFHGERKTIFKRCKQAHACNNNFIQNPRNAWTPTQCNLGDANNVCRCCCRGHLCNAAERPCASPNPCNINRANVVVVADSSSSVGFENFQIMKAFIKSLFAGFTLGDDTVRAALIRYNRDVEEQFNLAGMNDNQDVADAIDDMVYDGSGTRTGAALEYVRRNLLIDVNGYRPDVTTIVVVITDGRSQDSVLAPSESIRALGAITFAVGVGNIDPGQLDEIAGADDRVFVAQNFNELSTVVLDRLRDAVCIDTNECLENNGGCSHSCVNLQGSYRCECPEGLGLAPDNRNCIPMGDSVDDCAENNGGCEHFCTDLVDGVECSCREGYTLSANGRTCFDTDDCFNNTCSYQCVDGFRGFFCECPEDEMLGPDERTCVPRPGPADCPANYTTLGHSCMRQNLNELTHEEARVACEAEGARLLNLHDNGTRDLIRRAYRGQNWIGITDSETEGSWVYVPDATPFTYTAGWAPGQPGNGDCGYFDNNIFASRCRILRPSICEIPRQNGFMIFSRTWPNGALGNMYLPTNVNTVRVIFPEAVERFTVWFGSIEERVSRTEYVVSQNDIERQSGNGQVGFTIDMRRRFPDRDVDVENYE